MRMDLVDPWWIGDAARLVWWGSGGERPQAASTTAGLRGKAETSYSLGVLSVSRSRTLLVPFPIIYLLHAMPIIPPRFAS